MSLGSPSQGVLYAAQTTTVQVVKKTGGVLTGYYIANPHSAMSYVQFFDLAAGDTCTLGTTVPKYSFGVPTLAAANIPPSSAGLEFVNGIKLAVTTTATGSTAPATGCDVNVYFQ